MRVILPLQFVAFREIARIKVRTQQRLVKCIFEMFSRNAERRVMTSNDV